MKKITIKPVTRIEGHAKVDIILDEEGKVKTTYFHVEELRGFEKFLQGRKVWEAPRITARICGICPVSHHLAAAKACDNLFEVEVPETASLLRELMHMGQIIHSHSLHFFFLAAPDLLLTNESNRDITGIVKANPELVKKAIELRKIGQSIIQTIGGKAIHPVTAIPGGMTKSLSKNEKEKIEKDLKIGLELSKLAVDVVKRIVEKNLDFVKRFADIETNYMGLVKDANLEFYEGKIRLVSSSGKRLEEFNGDEYLNYIGEYVEDWSYLKFPFYKKFGWPSGVYRVGPLARMNVCEKISTSIAMEELNEFRKLFRYPTSQTLAYHYARLIELIYAVEHAEELIVNERITGSNICQEFKIKAGEGIGVIEAPRGTLIHHYRTDEYGNIKMANLIVATVHNNAAINLSIAEAVKEYIYGEKIDERALNKIEMAIRAYDPCLSCATHAIGQMPLTINLFDSKGKKINQLIRE